MPARRSHLAAAVVVMLLAAASRAWAGGGAAGAIVIVADSRRCGGWSAWWSALYNESHLQFALVTVAVMPVAAYCLGRITGALLGRIGIDLRSRVMAEH